MRPLEGHLGRLCSVIVVVVVSVETAYELTKRCGSGAMLAAPFLVCFG